MVPELTHLAITVLLILDITILVLLPLLDVRLYQRSKVGAHSFIKKYDGFPSNSIRMFGVLQPGKVSVLDSKVTMTVYGIEILESVLYRLQTLTGHNIGYDTHMLLPYKAKAMDYKNATVREILDGQMKGTPFKYRFMNQTLVIVKEETGKFAYDSMIHFFQKTSHNDKSRIRR